MTSLPVIGVCCLILTQWLTQQVTGLAWKDSPCQLDMAKDAFDDQYVGCTKAMEKKARQLLREDLKNNPTLKSEWQRAKKAWQQKKSKIRYPKQFNDFHGTALVTYTGSTAFKFNEAVRKFRQNSRSFHFKGFHYYLTRAVQLLGTGKCYKVYRGCQAKFHYTGNRPVRFGQFTSSSFSKAIALNFSRASGTVFTIQTCLGISIEEFSFYSYEKEVLIPGYEMYQKVIENTSHSYKNISLQLPKISKSNYNCYYMKLGTAQNFNKTGESGT